MFYTKKKIRTLVGYFLIVFGMKTTTFATEPRVQAHQACNFCRNNHVGVAFTPRVSIEDYINRYSETDLLPFVSKISTEFKIIISSFVQDSDNYHAVPNAVARWNANQSLTSNGTSSLELWIDVVLDPSKDTPAAFFYHLLDVINEANQISVGTVTTLIFPAHLAYIDPEYFHEFFTELREIFPRNVFKFALEWELSLLESQMKNHTSSFSKQITASFPLLDLIIFVNFLMDNLAYSIPIEELLIPEMQVVRNCVQFIKHNLDSINVSITFGVAGGITDTSENGFIAYSRLVETWKQMVQWGKMENLTVIFLNVFDTPRTKIWSYMTSGWWRLVENSSYNSTEQFVFEDKQIISEREKGRTPEKLISQLEQNFTFNREKVAVTFNPVLTPVSAKNQHRFNFSSVSTLLNIISSKFSCISLCYLNFIWRSLTPEVFARYNTNASSALNVIVTMNLTDGKEVDFITEKIVSANRLYPFTVTKVQLISVRGATNESITELRRKLGRSQSAVQIGYIFPIEGCCGEDDYFFEPRLQYFLNFVNFIHFSYIPGLPHQTSYIFGVDRVLLQVKTLFENCKRRVGNIFPGMGVGFETGFPDSLESRQEDYISLVLFWKEINEWAVQSNTNIILNGAFDSSYEHEDIYVENIYSKLGWWRATENLSDKNNLVIEEKKTVALKKYHRAITDGPLHRALEPGAVVIPTLVISISVVAVVLFALFFFMYKYKKSNASKSVNNLISYASQLQLNITGNDDILILPNTAFHPESSTLIGTGNFGAVYKCFIPQLQAEVAVKVVNTARPCGDNIDNFIATKSLLSEIKILSYVGRHQNILGILGVCQEGSLFIVTEYCKHGSLLSHLRSHSADNTAPTNYELLQFCIDIANGMDYLEKREVIHGDLSARNVLLDESKNCKISDFGLSRKLEHYEKYMKKGEEPLPWRWMAIESLTRMKFSAKSDVWSMGVTFWEVFTLGKLPFPEMRWNDDYCAMLASGLRLTKPTLADDNIYELIMACWHLESKLRPSSAEMSQRLLEFKSNEYARI